MSSITVPFNPSVGPIVDIVIAPPGTIGSQADVASPMARTYKALIDTGAAITFISRRVARETGLRVVGKRPMVSANRKEPANLYRADVYVPIGDHGGEPFGLICEWAELMEVMDDAKYQALLGRDVLELVVFTLDGPNKCFTLQVPSNS